ncbi:uncharacterized protein LOC127729329 [Mytilus californianus]|uniref:uncharacterized protein LOC127729329 n=1 Tax=Mytilus californianus TaxID=6549 RepID=UPI002247BD2C|nr:uncharacterized protein LOC127729329 [Mytilus californianus]
MSILAYIQTIYDSVGSFASYIYTFIISLVEFNFKAVTVTVETFQDIITTAVNIFKVINSILSNVISSALDFLVEIFGLLHAFVLVLWKFMVFLGSVLYSIYQCIEILLHFIAINAVWLLRLCTSGAFSGKEILIKICNLVSYYAVITFNQITVGISTIGTSGTEGIVTLFKTLKWCLSSFWLNIDSGMMAFAEGIRYVTDSIYYSMIDLIYLKRETYIGLIFCLLVFLVLANVFRSLKQRGMTFPGIQENFEAQYARVRPNFGFDFSDNEEDESDGQNEDESDITVASSEGDDDEEVEEYEVDDLTTDDEELSDSDSNASIDIQLPPVNSASYNLRRSTTPCSGGINTSEDFQKEIEKEKEKLKCVVCQDNDKSVLILPCRHLCLCLSCGNTIARLRNVDRRVCPLCRKRIETIMNVYT